MASGFTLHDRYVVEGPLGLGASCVVLAARDLSDGRAVAIKAPFAGLADDPRARARLAREADALARLRHPRVVRMLDASHVAEARPYLVLERVEGETLEAIVRRGPLPLGETVTRLRPIASALDAVHEAGLVHGDVKPGNLLYASETDGTLIDFGLTSPPEERGATDAWQISGTPAYLAPEGAMGRALDARSDVYSLACVAFEMLDGARPFDRHNVVATLTAKVTDPPPSLARRRGLPAALDEVFARALAVDPASRPASATELLHALTRVLEGRPAWTTPPPSAQATTGRPRERDASRPRSRRLAWELPLLGLATLSLLAAAAAALS